MKKILFAAFMIFAAFFIVSCSGEDEIANALGKSCAVEGEETCSDDNSQILVCRDLSWQTKKSCNLSFGQYCRLTDSGSYSCTDSGNTTEPTAEPTETEPTEPESDDSEPTDSEPTEPESNDSEPEDNEPVDDTDTDTENDNDTDEPVVQDLETCADIAKCRKNCDTGTCRTECYKRGTDEAKNDFDEVNQKCLTYTELEDLKHCQELSLKCGVPGDESYASPYGHAILNGSFSYINDPATTSFSEDTIVKSAFVIGNFGSNGNIPDATSTATFSYAELSKNAKYLVLNQVYNSNVEQDKTPYVALTIEATAPGTYLVGVDSKSKIEMDVYEPTTDSICYHAFGYGYLELDGTALSEPYSIGAGTITVKGEVDLYSFKNAPMYNGDITSSNIVACQPK